MIASASHKATNEKVFELISGCLSGKLRVLDLGAGRGHMARRVGQLLEKRGLKPQECLIATDIYSESFEALEIPFQEANFNKPLPFEDSSFDLVYSVEVIEHLRSPYDFLDECYRILRPGGKLILSTPNTLHLTSRWRFFMTGFFDLFEPPSILPENAGRLCGHIMPLHIAYYDYGLRLSGFDDMEIYCDKEKSLSKAIYFLLYPYWQFNFWKINRRIKKYDASLYQESSSMLMKMQSRHILTSRSLLISVRKPLR